MKGPCTLVAYINQNGNSPVLAYLAELERNEEESYIAFDNAKDAVEKYGTEGHPHWKWLKEGFGEIRWHVGRKQPRIFCSEEQNGRLAMLDFDARKLHPFIPFHRAKCRERREEFRSLAYKQDERRKLYLLNHPQNA